MAKTREEIEKKLHLHEGDILKCVGKCCVCSGDLYDVIEVLPNGEEAVDLSCNHGEGKFYFWYGSNHDLQEFLVHICDECMQQLIINQSVNKWRELSFLDLENLSGKYLPMEDYYSKFGGKTTIDT